MTKEEKNVKQQWARHCTCLILHTLLIAEREETRNGSDETAHGGCPGKEEVAPFPAGSLSKATFMLKDYSFASYLIAVWRLFKIALFHKGGEHFILVGYQSPPVTAAE
ncbi:MAG: hypothetical protein E7070_05140 [Bacteroidales bacterium]|nr:hypothetical protein [Bacteroidales bacterium]